MNTQNLIPVTKRTKEEARKISQNGGKASGESRKKKKMMREWAEIFGSQSIDVSLPGGKKRKTSFDGAVVFAQYQKAIKEGNVKSAYFLAQLKGEMEQNINVSSDQPVIIVKSEEEAEKVSNLDKLGI